MERRISLGDALAAFHQDRAISCAPSTVTLQKRILRPLEGSERPVVAYDGILCRELLLAKSHVQPNTRMTCFVALSAFGRWLAEQQFLPANPMEGVPKPRVTEERPHRYLTPEEIRRLFAVLGQGKRDTETRLILWLLLEGLRASELCAIRWADIRADRIVVRGKGGKVRAVPLRKQVNELLGQRLNLHHGRIFAFSSDALRHRIALLGRRAGILGVHCHLFRHSMASLSLLAGMNPEHLRALGGWSARSEVWERYVKSVREDAAIKAALELDLSGRIFGE